MEKLHHATLKSAVAKYLPLQKDGKTAEEIKSAIKADEKGFAEEHVNEIYEAIVNFKEDPAPSKPAGPKKYVVVKAFRDLHDFNKEHHVGTDVSHLHKDRLDHLLKTRMIKEADDE